MDLDYIKVREEDKERLLGLNLWQFNESPNLNKLLELIVDLGQETSTLFVNISEGWLLSKSEGSQLDYLGEELRVERGAYNDEEYKLLQLLISKFRYGSVTQESIIEAVQILAGDAPVDIYRGQYKNLDIVFFADCRSSLVIGKEITRLLPLVTSVRLLAKAGTPFGFEGDGGALGFGTISGDNSSAGSLTTLIIG